MCPGARRTAWPCMLWLWTSPSVWRWTSRSPVTTTPASSRRPFSWPGCTTTASSSTRCSGPPACSQGGPSSSWWWSSRSTSPGCVKRSGRSRSEMRAAAVKAKHMVVWWWTYDMKGIVLTKRPCSDLLQTFLFGWDIWSSWLSLRMEDVTVYKSELNVPRRTPSVRHVTGCYTGKTMTGFCMV